MAAEVGRLPDKDEQIELAEKAVKDKLPRSRVIEEVRAKRPPRSQKPDEPKSTSEPASEPRFTQVEITLGLGRAVLVSGVPAGAGPEGTLEILFLAIDKLKTQIAATV